MEGGGLCMLAWKKRTGFGSVVSQQKWERRWIVVSESRILYYSLGDEDAPTPRGVLDLVVQSATIHVPAKMASDAPTPYQLDITAQSYDETSIVHWKLCFDTQQDQLHLLETVHNILFSGGYDEKDVDRFEHEFEAGDHVYRWEMLVLPPIISPIQIHGIVLEAGRNCVIIGDFGLTGYGKQEGASFNHAQDHNKSILAAWKKLRPKEDQRLNIVTLLDPKEIRKWKKANYGTSSSKKSHSSMIGGRLSKFFSSSKRPEHATEDNDTIATDATVVEEQDETAEDNDSGSVGGRLSTFFKRSEFVRQDSVGTDGTVVAKESSVVKEKGSSDEPTEEGSRSGWHKRASGKVAPVASVEEEEEPPSFDSNRTKEQAKTDGERGESPKKEQEPSSFGLEAKTEEEQVHSSGSANETSVNIGHVQYGGDAVDTNEIEEGKHPGDDIKEAHTAKEEQSNGDTIESCECDTPSPVAGHHKNVSHSHPAHQELPKSDPKKIVLARANFLLEHGEEILPPYHIFFSNSECIAVWCKTGRWSTLQTAVYLTGHSVGAAKSSTMATLGVVAAHAVLAPVVAVGGLIWVSAPMVILQQSQKKWNEATMKLTALFWEWAPPEVFVAAIENWSDIH